MISWLWTKLRQHGVSLSSYKLCTSSERLWCTTLAHVWPFLFSTMCFNEDKQIWHKSRGNCLQQFCHLTLHTSLSEGKNYGSRVAKTLALPHVCPQAGNNLFTLKSKTVITRMILTRKYQKFSRLLKERSCQTGYSPLLLEAKCFLPDPLTLLVWGLKWV